MKTIITICLIVLLQVSVFARNGHPGMKGQNSNRDAEGKMRGNCDSCVAQGSSSAGILQVYRQELAYARRLVEQAEKRSVTPASSGKNKGLLQRARKHLGNAGEAAMRRQYYSAMEELRMAENLALRSMELVKITDGKRLLAAHRQVQARLKGRIAALRGLKSAKSDLRIRNITGQCRHLLQDAGQAMRQGNGAKADALEKICEKLLQQAVLLASQNSDTLRQQALKSFDRLKNELGRINPGEGKTRDLVKRTRSISRQAEVLLKKGKIQQAMSKIDLGLSMVRRAARLSGSDLQAELDRTERLVAEARKQAGEGDDPLVRQAEAALNRARVSFRQGKTALTRRRIAETRRLVFRAMANGKK